jgi:NADPH-dependent 2,4-dienoyl-CoA reductase/sulfur reductase-like enzyme
VHGAKINRAHASQPRDNLRPSKPKPGCHDRRVPPASDETTRLIAGGGPAGMVLGLLLARTGVKVTVMEKRADFLRDLRRDTVHASASRVLDELGLAASRTPPEAD